jgi:hypothetical protein
VLLSVRVWPALRWVGSVIIAMTGLRNRRVWDAPRNHRRILARNAGNLARIARGVTKILLLRFGVRISLGARASEVGYETRSIPVRSVTSLKPGASEIL